MHYTNKQSIAMKFYRAENWFYRKHCRFMATLIYHLMQLFLGCTIPYSVEMGEDVDIAHYHGIVIHHECRIGEGTILYQNITIGGRNGKGGGR